MTNEELQHVTDILIQQSFPELFGMNIVTIYTRIKDGLLQYCFLEGQYSIDVDIKLKNISEKEMMGGIAHELCHIVHDKKLTKYKSIVDDLLYGLDELYRIANERNTDLAVILRGLGQELLAFEKFAVTTKRYKPEGMTIEELQRIV